jgi:hypothetical protein
MSQHFFAVHSGEFGRKLKSGVKAARKRDRIAKSIDKDAGYVYYFSEAEHRWYGHGYCRNLGEPFDSTTARAIEEAWAEAGV